MAAGMISPPPLSNIPTPDPADLAPPAVQPGAAPIASQPASGTGAAPLDPAAPPPPPQAAGASGPLTPPSQTPAGKSLVQAQPPEPPKFDPKKLAKVQTTLDLLNAMVPKSRTDYMGWWEKQHGDIDQRYNQLQQQLGARPADDQPTSKKEKFAQLLEFGLHLMKNSAAPSTDQGAVLEGTLSNSIEQGQQAHQQAIQQGQQQYDANSNAIEKAREADQKQIGTPIQAMNAQSAADKAQAGGLKDTAAAAQSVDKMLSPSPTLLGAPTYAVGPDGKTLGTLVRGSDGTSKWQPVVGIDGKPFAGRVLGRSTGSGVAGAGSTTQIKNEQYLEKVMGLTPALASQIAFKVKTNNPAADHLSVYKSVLGATDDPGLAKAAADRYVVDSYGAGALTRVAQPLIQGAPPQSALAGLVPGQPRYFGPKGTWTIDAHGNPKRLDTPQPVLR